MERYKFQDYNREYMKRAILKQEETFREQVNELHRLYQMQKMMMSDLKSFTIQRRSTSEKNNGSCHFSPNWPIDYQNNSETDVESDLELTLATGGNRRRGKKKKNQENYGSGVSRSSSSTESVGESLKLNEWFFLETEEKEKKKNYNNSDQKNNFHMDHQAMRQQQILKHPSWHLQCLSLKMT